MEEGQHTTSGTARVVVHAFGAHLSRRIGSGVAVRVRFDAEWASTLLLLAQAAYKGQVSDAALSHLDPSMVHLYLLPDGEELTEPGMLAGNDRLVVYVGSRPLYGRLDDPHIVAQFSQFQPAELRPSEEVLRQVQESSLTSTPSFSQMTAPLMGRAGSFSAPLTRPAALEAAASFKSTARTSSSHALTPSLRLSTNAKLRRVVRKLVAMNRLRKGITEKGSLAHAVTRSMSAKRRRRSGASRVGKTMDAFIREQSNIYSYNEQRSTEEQQLPWHIIDPEAPAKVAWDVLILLLVMFYGVIVPYRIGFQEDGTEAEQIFDDVANVLFMMDIVFSFRTAFKEDGVLVRDPRRLAITYAQSWFIIDLVASVPLDWFIDTKGGINKLLRTMRLFKLFRMLRLLKLFPRLFQVLETNIKFNPSMIRFLRSFIVMLLMWHCIACAYWWVVRVEYGGYYTCAPGVVCWVNKCVCDPGPFDPSATPDVMGDIPDEDYDPLWATDQPADQWVPGVYSANRPNLWQYSQALFWAVEVTTGIGGDIMPKTQLEVAFTTSMTVVGLMMYSLIIGSASSALANMDSTATQRRQTLDKVSAYMRSRRVPAFFQRIIVDFYQHMWTTPMKESDVFRDLPDSLRSRLSMVLNRDLIDRIPVFQHMPAPVYIRLVQKLLHNTYLPGEFVIRQGETPRCIYFVKRGMADAILPTGDMFATFEPGDFFGENAVLHNHKRSQTVRAVDFLDVLQLRKEDFMELYATAPRFLEEVRKADAERQQLRLAKELEIVRRQIGLPADRPPANSWEGMQAAGRRGLRACTSAAAVEPGPRVPQLPQAGVTQDSAGGYDTDDGLNMLRTAIDGGEVLGGIAASQAFEAPAQAVEAHAPSAALSGSQRMTARRLHLGGSDQGLVTQALPHGSRVPVVRESKVPSPARSPSPTPSVEEGLARRASGRLVEAPEGNLEFVAARWQQATVPGVPNRR